MAWARQLLPTAGGPSRSTSRFWRMNLARGQIVNLRAFDGGIELPIEILQGLEFAEGRALFAALDLTMRTDIDLVLEDQFQGALREAV